MAKFYDRVALKTTTTGTGTVSLGDPITTAFFTPAEAGMENGDEVAYQILDGGDVEVGVGTYSTGSPATFSRDTVIKSRIGGVAGTSKINLSGKAVIRFGPTAEDLSAFVSAAAAFGTGNRVLRSDGTGRDVKVTGITVDDNARMTGHGNMAWQAATESSGEISWDCQNGALLNWYVTASGAAEVQAPDNLPDGWTCLIEIDPDGEDITWAEEYRLPVPEIAAKAVIAILRRGSEYIATVVHEEEAE